MGRAGPRQPRLRPPCAPSVTRRRTHGPDPRRNAREKRRLLCRKRGIGRGAAGLESGDHHMLARWPRAGASSRRTTPRESQFSPGRTISQRLYCILLSRVAIAGESLAGDIPYSCGARGAYLGLWGNNGPGDPAHSPGPRRVIRPSETVRRSRPWNLSTRPPSHGPVGLLDKRRTRRARRADAGWSSPVARQAHNLKVAGSNPAPATKFAR